MIVSPAVPVQATPRVPAAPQAPRVEGPLSQAEVRDLARELAAAKREGLRADAQVREAQRMADQQVAAELARQGGAQPNPNELAAAQAAQARAQAEEAARQAEEAARQADAASELPAPGTITVQRDGKTIVLGEGAPPGTPIALEPPRSDADVIAETAQETIGMVGGMALGGLFLWLFFRTIQKWLDARKAPQAFPRETMDRLARIENAIEAMAVEVERISEGQRFTTRLLSEKVPVERGG